MVMVMMIWMQVNIGLRVLTRPNPDKLPEIYRNLGTDYAERVLPSIIQVGVVWGGGGSSRGGRRKGFWGSGSSGGVAVG